MVGAGGVYLVRLLTLNILFLREREQGAVGGQGGGVGVGAGAEVCLEPKISKMGGYGNPGSRVKLSI